MSQNENVLPTTIVRAIGDKLYDRRKTAALEVEGLIKNLAAQGNSYRISLIVNRLVNDYAFSPQTNYRKGGLLSLAAATVALADLNQDDRKQYMDTVIPAVLNSLVDQDARVRYYALEALFNIAKVTREGFMPFFADTFEALFRLSADMDSAVHQATTYLDNLLKDIVTASPNFDVDDFVPQLREFLAVHDMKQCMFLLRWITLLVSVPDVDLLSHLPQLLGGLLDTMQNEWHEVREAARKALEDFLADIRQGQSVDFNSLANVLCQRAEGSNPMVQLTCMAWLKELVALAKPALKAQYADILSAVLPTLSHSKLEIREEAKATNESLLDLPPEWQPHDTRQVLAVVSAEMGSEREVTRLAALNWMTALLAKSRATVMESLDMLLPALLDALSASSERVVVESLTVQASIAKDEDKFRHLMHMLLDRFRGQAGSRLLARRGSLVVRKLAEFLGGEKVFSALSASLEKETDLQFAASMVQALNLILLTAPEVRKVRRQLAGEDDKKRGAQVFEALYKSWSHSAGAALSLCFLAQAYDHASDLIGVFRDVRMGIETLVQIDRLVQILETPVFTCMRLHLLQPSRYPALIRSMYGLLMLLPQSTAFKTLHARLHSVPALALLQLEQCCPSSAGGEAAGTSGREPEVSTFKHHVDYPSMLILFRQLQEKHVEAEEGRMLASKSDEQTFRKGWSTDRTFPPLAMPGDKAR